MVLTLPKPHFNGDHIGINLQLIIDYKWTINSVGNSPRILTGTGPIVYRIALKISWGKVSQLADFEC